MAKRSVSDEEIGLIKAMLRRGMKNQEIQFHFNKPNRPVNSGRITQIRQGTYGPSVPEASEKSLEIFLSGSEQPQASTMRLDRKAALSALFEERGGEWRLIGGETDQIECKREVDIRKFSSVIRAIAAMSNNRGGTILLGVEDKSGRVVGLPDDSFQKLDLVKITNAVKAHLQPTPSFTKGVFELGGLNVGFIDVEGHRDRPVIVYRPGDRLEDGAILFRYPAESANIKFGDLRTLLDERDNGRLRALAQITQRVAEIGPDHAAVLSMTDGTLSLGDRPLTVDQALLEHVKFIREGHFDEVSGGPALKIVGEITTASGEPVASGRRVITDEDVLRNFLNQEVVFSPIEYLRYAATGTNRDWLPIFFFAKQAKLSGSEAAGLMGTFETAKIKHRAGTIARAYGNRSAYAKPTGSPAKCLERILDGDGTLPSDLKSAEHVAIALRGIRSSHPPALNDMLALLKAAYEILVAAERWSTISYIYRSAARLDEVYFGGANK